MQYAECERGASVAATEAAIPTLESLRARREEILRLAAARGASNVRVFGSIAAGYANEQSDIDLLVDLEPGRSLLELGGLAADLEELLGRRVDVLETPRRRTRTALQIRREAVPL